MFFSIDFLLTSADKFHTLSNTKSRAHRHTVLVRRKRKTMSSSLLLLMMLMTSFTLRTASADDARISAGFLVVSPPSVSLQGTCLHVYVLLFCRAFCCFAGHVCMCILLFCRTQVYMCILLFCGVCRFSGHMFTCVFCSFAGASLRVCCFAGHIFTCVL